jgi:hypothetical protein
MHVQHGRSSGGLAAAVRNRLEMRFCATHSAHYRFRFHVAALLIPAGRL